MEEISLARSDVIEYHDNQNYPGHGKAVFGVVIVLGVFFAAGIYSLMGLWSAYGTQVMNFINDILSVVSLVISPTDAAIVIGAIVLGIIFLSLFIAYGASYLAKRLGGILIYIGAFFMNIMTLAIPILIVVTGGPFTWPVFIPGLFTLFITILLFTVFKDRIRRAGEIIKLTGQVCLDEKGVFVPPLLVMIFTLISAVMFGGIAFYSIDVLSGGNALLILSGSMDLTIETGWVAAVGIVLYLFATIFFYNFAYGTSSAMVYIYMRGRDPDLGDGVKSTLGVITGIIALSLMSVIVVIVRMIIQTASRRAGGAGAVVGGVASGLIGWIWALLNYFTIPAMVAEELGAKDGIKRSAGLVKNNFVDVMIKETAVRWGFGALAALFFLAFALGGAVIGYVAFGGDLIATIVLGIVFAVLAGIPVSLVLRTFDIVYVTLLYVFIRRKEGDITGKTAIPDAMSRELDGAYSRAQSSQ
ncbi:MAG: DUF6159 family protein [Candidatus Thorarchaeota archaeon]